MEPTHCQLHRGMEQQSEDEKTKQSHSGSQGASHHSAGGTTSGSPPKIPEKLDSDEVMVYRELGKVHSQRLKHGKHPERVFVISDIAKDLDDLVAWVILKELHRLKLIELKGFITNLSPMIKRAQFGRGALDTLGLQSIPVATGLEATKDASHVEQDHEFVGCTFMAPKTSSFEHGEDLLHHVLAQAKKEKYKVRLLLISGLQDIAEFSQRHPTLLKEQISYADMQGGYEIVNGHLTPIQNAANNNFNMAAANTWHAFIDKNKIASTVYTKVAALAEIPLHSSLFVDIEATGHPIGRRLREIQKSQEKAFYSRACEELPQKRFQPWMDQIWYLQNKTTWWTKKKNNGEFLHRQPQYDDKGVYIPGTGDVPEPRDIEAVTPFFDRLSLYDALPAVGCAGDDVLDALKVLDLPIEQKNARHRVVGVESKDGKPKDPCIHKEQMALVLRALIKGSILACQ